MLDLAIVPIPLFAFAFLSPWLLLGGLALAIPIAIHFWRRQHRTEMPWAAMRFLMQAVRKRSRRSRFEQWLLLALRLLTILMLVLAAARPAINRDVAGALASTDTDGKLVILVLDSSYSMNHEGEDRSPRNMAQAEAEAFIKTLSKRDAISVVQMASPPMAIVPVATFAHEKIQAELLDWKTFDADADFLATLRLIQQMVNENRERIKQLTQTEIVFFSDLGKNTWSKVQDPEVVDLVQSLTRSASIRVQSCRPIALKPNLGVTILAMEQANARPGSPVVLRSQIKNFSDRPSGNVSVQLLIDGRTEASKTISLEPGQESALQFEWSAPRAGSYLAEVRLPADGLENDNSQWMVMDVKSEVKLLVLESSERQAAYLEAAIAPDAIPARGYDVQRLTMDRMREVNLRDFDIVVLCDCRVPSDSFIKEWKEYVLQGGQSIVWFGPFSNPDMFNQLAMNADAADQGIMPFRLAGPSQRASYEIDPLDYASPIAEAFRDFPESGLLSTPIYQYLKLDQLDRTKATVELGLSNADPLVISNSAGLGRTTWIMTPPTIDASNPDDAWNALVAWPSFLPLVQELIDNISRYASAPHNLRVGQALVGNSAKEANSPLRITLPDGRVSEIMQSNDAKKTWVFADTMRRGSYRVTAGTSEPEQIFAVNVDTHESESEWLDLIELPANYRSEPKAEKLATLTSQSSAVEISFYLLVALLMLVFGETFATWALGSKR